MLKSPLFLLGMLFVAAACGGAEKSSAPTRTIRLRQDDAQIRFASRIYELAHVRSEEILPFVNSAILRYNRNSTIRRVTTVSPDSKDAILVSTGREFLPYVDAIIKALDRPGRVDADGSTIQGTGLARIAYSPEFRAARQFSEIIDRTLGSSVGAAYVNDETNTIFWRDQTAAAKKTLAWMEKLDRPLPQVDLRLNYYELRDSDLKDWGFDYLAWKNGPGVNLLNIGYNAGHLAIDELISSVQYAASASWGYGGFFTAPQIDMSFIRCLQQSGNANAVASASLTMVNTPVSSREEYRRLLYYQSQYADQAPYIYRVSMTPEYQNIAKNVLGRTFVGKSFYEDEDGVKHADSPSLEARITNPFICFQVAPGTEDKNGFIPADPAFYARKNQLRDNGGLLFHYSLYFKSVVERGNTGAELGNSASFSGATTLGFGREKLLAVYEKENDVEQTIGLPILCRIPYLKYLFSTVTSIKERTYIVVTAEAELRHPNPRKRPAPVSASTAIKRRIENPFRKNEEQ